MIYLYSKPMCSACMERKEELHKQGLVFIERDSGRILAPLDDIDKEAVIQISMQGKAITNIELPVEIEINKKEIFHDRNS